MLLQPLFNIKYQSERQLYSFSIFFSNLKQIDSPITKKGTGGARVWSLDDKKLVSIKWTFVCQTRRQTTAIIVKTSSILVIFTLVLISVRIVQPSHH